MAYRDSTISVTTTDTDIITMTWPTVSAGDRAILFVSSDGDAGTWGETVGDFTLVSGEHMSAPDSQSIAVYEKRVCDGTETGTFDIVPLSSITLRKVAILVTLSGRDQGAPVRFATYTAHTTDEPSPIDMAADSGVVRDGDDLLGFWSVDQLQDIDVWDYSTPSGFVKREEGRANFWTSGMCATKDSVTGSAFGPITSTATRSVGVDQAGWGSLVVAVSAPITASVVLRDDTSAEEAFVSTISVDTPTCVNGDTLVLAISVLQNYDTAVITLPSVTGWASPWKLRNAVAFDTAFGGWVYTTTVTNASSAPATLDVGNNDNYVTRLGAYTFSGVLRVGRADNDEGFGTDIVLPSVRDFCNESVILFLLNPSGAVTETPPGLTAIQTYGTDPWGAYVRASDTGDTGNSTFVFTGGPFFALELVLEAVPPPGTLINTIAQAFASDGTTTATDSTGAGLIVANFNLGRPTSDLPISFTDSLSNGYSLLEQPNYFNLAVMSLYSCLAPTTGESHTFTVTASEAESLQIIVSMYYGVFISVDQHGSDPSVFVSTSTPGPITTTAANELVVTAGSGQGGASLLVNDEFMYEDFVDKLGVASRMQAVPGEVDPTWTFGFVVYGFSTIASFELEPEPDPEPGVRKRQRPAFFGFNF